MKVTRISRVLKALKENSKKGMTAEEILDYLAETAEDYPSKDLIKVQICEWKKVNYIKEHNYMICEGCKRRVRRYSLGEQGYIKLALDIEKERDQNGKLDIRSGA